MAFVLLINSNQLIGSLSHDLQGFSTIPGGWPWDFGTINSTQSACSCHAVSVSRCFPMFQAPGHTHIAHRLVSTSCNVAGQYTPGETTGDLILTYGAVVLYLLLSGCCVFFPEFRCIVLDVFNKPKNAWVYSLLRSLRKHTKLFYIHRYSP